MYFVSFSKTDFSYPSKTNKSSSYLKNQKRFKSLFSRYLSRLIFCLVYVNTLLIYKKIIINVYFTYNNFLYKRIFYV